MSDQLTTLERLALERWAVRREQTRRKILMAGTFGWGGLFALFFGLWMFQQQQLTFRDLIILIGLSLVGGFGWGWSMWALLDCRYRLLRKKAAAHGT